MLEGWYGPDARWVSVEKVAAQLRVANNSIYRWAEAGSGADASESDSRRGANARSPKNRSSR